MRKKANKIKYDLIIFDCDGTLVDSESLINTAFSEIMIVMGYKKYTYDYCLEVFRGYSYPHIATYITQEHPEFPYKQFEEKFIAIANYKINNDLKVMPNANIILEALSNYKKCVVSNGENEIVVNSLKDTGLIKYFKREHIYTYELVKYGKPSPELLLYAAEKFKAAPKQCLVIEDSIPGITAAISAGMDTLAYLPLDLYGKSNNIDQKIKNLNPMAIISDLKEVLNYVV